MKISLELLLNYAKNQTVAMVHLTMTQLVQPILVLVNQPRNHIIRDVALASVKALIEIYTPNWESWLMNSFTKTVRKAKNQHVLDRLCGEYGFVQINSAAAGIPEPYADYPNLVSKARVSGWEEKPLPSTLETRVATHTLYLNSSLNMTTGKSAAQAAHSLMLYSLMTSLESVDSLVLEIQEIPEQDFDMNNQFLIVDNGLTEIPAKSVTAFIEERRMA